MQTETHSKKIPSLAWQAADCQTEGQDALLLVLVGKFAKPTACLDHNLQKELHSVELAYPENFYISI